MNVIDVRLFQRQKSNNKELFEDYRDVKKLAKNSVLKEGDRGVLKGYEELVNKSGSITININSEDCINLNTSGNVTLTFQSGAESQHSVKVLNIKATAATVLTINGATFANGESAPDWGSAGQTLVLLAHFVGGRVLLNTIDNTQG